MINMRFALLGAFFDSEASLCGFIFFSGGLNNNEMKKKANDSVGLGSLKDAPPLPGVGKKNDQSPSGRFSL